MEENMSKNKGSNILFRTSMSGFNKEDVNKYIQDENRRFAALEGEYTEKIDGMKRELELAKAEIERLTEHYEAYLALQREAEDLRTSLDKSNDVITALTEKADSASAAVAEADQKNVNLLDENVTLREKIKTMEATIAEKDSEIEGLRIEVKNATTENAELRKKIVEDNAFRDGSEKHPATEGMTDDEKNQFGDMLLRAKYASEDMLKRAEEGAGIIIDRAKDEMFTHRNEAVRAAKEIFNAATEELRRSIGICMNDFAAAIRNAKNDPARTSEAANICDDDLGRRIERMQNDLDRAIAEKLAEFDSRN